MTINQILTKIIQIQTQTINKLNGLNIEYKLPSSVVQLNENNKIPEEYLSDYTAFEVIAHDTAFGVGEFSMTIDNQTFSNKIEIPAGMTHEMRLRTMQSVQADSDVVVDWGDGTIESVRDGDFTSAGGDATNGEADWTCTHTYTENGKYIVKIYGKDYYCIYQSDANNLICRAIDHDLPIASHLKNLSKFLYQAKRLLYLNVDRIKYNYYVNFSGFCSTCVNLVKAVGFGRNFQQVHATGMFGNCFSMEYCDFQLPYRAINDGAFYQTFWNCYSLSVDINQLFPDRPLPMYIKSAKFYKTFYNCPALTGTISENTKKLLWDMRSVSGVEAESMSECFIDCSDALRAQVPASWGGTASDDIIKPTLEEQIADLTARIAALENA